MTEHDALVFLLSIALLLGVSRLLGEGARALGLPHRRRRDPGRPRVGYPVPDNALVHTEQRGLFALFIGVALSISALPVTAKTLLDLGLFKTEVGMLVMTSTHVAPGGPDDEAAGRTGSRRLDMTRRADRAR